MSRASDAETPITGMAVFSSTDFGSRIQRIMFSDVFSMPAREIGAAPNGGEWRTDCAAGVSDPGNRMAGIAAVRPDQTAAPGWVCAGKPRHCVQDGNRIRITSREHGKEKHGSRTLNHGPCIQPRCEHSQECAEVNKSREYP